MTAARHPLPPLLCAPRFQTINLHTVHLGRDRVMGTLDERDASMRWLWGSGACFPGEMFIFERLNGWKCIRHLMLRFPLKSLTVHSHISDQSKGMLFFRNMLLLRQRRRRLLLAPGRNIGLHQFSRDLKRPSQSVGQVTGIFARCGEMQFQFANFQTHAYDHYLGNWQWLFRACM